MKEIINSNNAPAPIGPYSQAVKFGNLIYLSGQIAINSANNEIVLDSIEDETHQVMKNIETVLKEANSSLENIIKTSIFLKNMDDFTKVNEIYGSYFSKNFPARETVQVAKLPKDVNVEISVIAFGS